MESEKHNKLVNITKGSRLTPVESKVIVTTGEGEEGGAVYKSRRVRGTDYWAQNKLQGVGERYVGSLGLKKRK